MTDKKHHGEEEMTDRKHHVHIQDNRHVKTASHKDQIDHKTHKHQGHDKAAKTHHGHPEKAHHGK
jgi:hypothetical protein